MTNEALAGALVLGLMGAGHCLGMCGGVAAALAFAAEGRRAKRYAILLAYNIGRIFSYALAGAAFAYVFGSLDTLTPMPILRVASGLLLIAMGLYLADWWRGLTRLEALGARLWVYLAPLAKRLMPVKRVDSALLLGLIWGWLPCGLVYSVLALAAAQGHPLAGASVMAAFGLGTLPAVFLGGLASEWVKSSLQKRWLRTIFALAFIVYGGYTLIPVTKMVLVNAGIMQPSPQSHMHHH